VWLPPRAAGRLIYGNAAGIQVGSLPGSANKADICPPMAAIANAINAAIGVRMTELPMSPPKVLKAIDAKA